MSAFFVANVEVLDREKFQEYSLKANETIVAFGGVRVIRGFKAEVFAGDTNDNAIGVFRFADAQAISDWYNSPEYQALIPLREEASNMSIVSFSEPD
ncbi:MAG: DUF1330 domain-containing protein [Paracoccaceae bacterium]